MAEKKISEHEKVIDDQKLVIAQRDHEIDSLKKKLIILEDVKD